jgi:PBSX family phage terminase large subunit
VNAYAFLLVLALTQPTETRLVLNGPASEAFNATELYVDLEGGIRASKTTPGVAKVAAWSVKYPGIHCLISRWTDESLNVQLKPAWRAMAHQMGLELKWHGEEQYDEIVLTTPSRVYLRGLRAGEGTSRYAKFRGLDLAFGYLDQAEEAPLDVWNELKGRLSQPGYPKQFLITPQPVNEDHWIAREFPIDNSRLADGYRYIHTNVYHNRAIVGDAYIRELENAYPLGSAQRRTLLEGHRGLAVHGEAVYAGYFNRQQHVREDLRINPHLPLIEAWDFGHSHPCVIWLQFLPIGAVQILGAVMGHNLYLEDFAPIALNYRAQWCPNPMEVWSTGDPAGLMASNQGLRSTVSEILAEHGIALKRIDGANQPEIRYGAIQALSQYMRRSSLDGQPAFRIHPRAAIVSADGVKHLPFLVDGFEAGYVWDTRQVVGLKAGIRRPRKDGYYDHGQNCVEYAQIGFGVSQPTQTSVKKAEQRAIRHAQKDCDEADRPMRRSGGRGGY